MKRDDEAALADRSTDALYQEAESKTNLDNIRCLLVLAATLLLGELLNEVRVFKVAPFVMRLGVTFGVLSFITPVTVLAHPLGLLRRGRAMVYRRWHKYLILAFAWLGTIAAGIMLTHHTVIAMAVPLLLMAQYRNTRELVPLSAVLATVCVLLGVYGGYFWGCFDGNLLHVAFSEELALNLPLRLELATPQRMLELLTHYALPRELTVMALLYLATQISRRSDEMLRGQAQLESSVEREMRRANEMQRQIIDGMANLIENRDTSTGAHVKRTRDYVEGIVRELQKKPAYRKALGGKNAETIIKAAPLHDIGKVVVSDRILQKPGRLTPEEYEEIKLHAAAGVQVIDSVLGSVEDEEFLRVAKEIAGGHHERWDGKGYPDGLRGTEIPLPARIMAVADVFDALVSRRVYKSPVPPEEAFAIIESESGRQFDPDVVAAFCHLKPQLMAYVSADTEA